MKKIIWKYVGDERFVVDKDTQCMIKLPVHGRIIHAEIVDDGRMVIWVEFKVPHDWDGKSPMMVDNYFSRVPTGAMTPDRFEHFHTFISDGGTFVWHLYRFEDCVNGID